MSIARYHRQNANIQKFANQYVKVLKT